MNYKAIMVDMDHCADPLWVSEDATAPYFANGDLSEFEGVLSKGLLHGLKLYQTAWEAAMWSKYMSPDAEDHRFPGMDLVFDMLFELVVPLAAELKEQLPECRVFYRKYDENTGRGMQIEIGGEDNSAAIRPTLVG